MNCEHVKAALSLISMVLNFAQVCLLLGTASQMSNATLRPLAYTFIYCNENDNFNFDDLKMKLSGNKL